VESVIIRVEMADERAVVSGASAQLVASARAGDGDAFERLVEPHLTRAVGAASLITGSESDGAEERR
jgi:hypothetical protein